MIQEYYSNGKLLISGEYVVLEGAKAFALPTQYGQSLTVKENNSNIISWTSYDVDGQVWMKEEVAISDIYGTESIPDGSNYYQTLVEVLRAAHKQNPAICVEGKGYEVVSKLTFPRLWGLGTSSTWINNVAQWFDINPYQLLQESFGGSGYDIACACYNTGVFYTLTDLYNPKVKLIDFKPPFADNIYFVYLNQKKSSKEAIANFRAQKSLISEQVKRISEISVEMSMCTELIDFMNLMDEHEFVMSQILKVPTVKENLFNDFNGSIKSLGGWGGDFVMVATTDNPKEYFKSKGYEIMIKYTDMIIF
ncbi:GHMP kinase [Myroides marinus]|uniref:GYDIA family GHMP kinase n=1 Tax=Myroides marinus TaxID=703342 RepID=UPI000741EA61|nr:GYDIA family GHMP kinase [Myroides marinus]KUF38691.1 GHMP kinase [Myroides marinus]